MEYIKIAAFFAAGVYLYERIDTSIALIFMLSLIMVLTIKAIFKHKFDTKIFIMMSALVLGVVLCHVQTCDDIRDLSFCKDHYATVTGRVADIPQRSGNNTRYVIDARRVSFNGENRKIKEKILLTSDSKLDCGDTVTFSGFVNTISEKMNEDGFDYRTYYISKGIFFKMYSSSVVKADFEIHDYSLRALNIARKRFISDIIDEHYTGDYNALMKAMLTGNKDEFSDEYAKILDRTMTKRFLYPAYLHVMLFMAFISLFLGILERKKRDIMTVFLLIIYMTACAESMVFIKLCTVIALLTAAKRFLGYAYYLDIIGIMILALGIISPLILFNSGFVMSTLSSILIYYFFDSVYNKLKFIKFRYIRRSVTIGLICMIGLIPVSMYFYNGVSVYSVLISLVMMPCVAVIVVLSPLLIAMLTVFHAAPVIEQAVRFMLFIIARIPVIADKLYMPNLASPTAVMFIIYALLVTAAVKRVKNKISHERAALFTASALIVSVLFVQLCRVDDIDVTFVNVGQGDGALISAPYRFNVLIDGGGGSQYSDYNPGEKVYLEYLKAQGINKVDSAFVSHYHKDHVQGIIAAVENIKVKNLFMPDNMEDSNWRTELERAASENGTKIHYISEETLLTYKNGMTIRAIPPSKKTLISDEENDTSYVYYLEYGDFSAMFTGDMTSFAEKNLIDTGKVRQADVLKVAHHGSDTSTCKQWVDAVKPEYAVISAGKNNTYDLPDSEVLERLEGAQIYRTDFDGDIRFIAEKDGIIKIKTLNRR